jgi:Meckel syndrome type 1 protein
VGSAAASSQQQSAPAPAPTTQTTVVYASPPPAAAPPPSATLPCQANVINANGMTYYQCGPSWYMQAYGSAGPVYMPVSPPQ